ncbi:MAG: class I SAM-dependent methyltransferase [Planctomycetota bacterium]
MPKGKTKKSKEPTLADLADKQDLYLQSVQDAEHEVDFFEQAYKEAFGKKPTTLREDFCGTFKICCEWVKSSKKRTAIGVDLDGPTLDYGRDHYLPELTKDQQARIKLMQDDVRTVGRDKVDVLAAQNFSFWIFKTRDELREYFRKARMNLKPNGVMVLDMMGGGDCYIEEHEDVRSYGKGKKRFKYVWEQASHNPVTGDSVFHIHFRFPDGSALEKAFTYDWRFWTIPEVRELLTEAGFDAAHVYWEEEDDDGESTWHRVDEADADPSWIAYIVAERRD